MHSRIIYRMQNIVGRGPFQPGLTAQWLSSRSDEDLKRFVITSELLAKVNEIRSRSKNRKYFTVYACDSPEQLQQWFPEEDYRNLLALGFHACRIKDCKVEKLDNNQFLALRRIPFQVDAKPFNLWKLQDIKSLCTNSQF